MRGVAWSRRSSSCWRSSCRRCAPLRRRSPCSSPTTQQSDLRLRRCSGVTKLYDPKPSGPGATPTTATPPTSSGTTSPQIEDGSRASGLIVGYEDAFETADRGEALSERAIYGAPLATTAAEGGLAHLTNNVAGASIAESGILGGPIVVQYTQARLTPRHRRGSRTLRKLALRRQMRPSVSVYQTLLSVPSRGLSRLDR